MINRKLGLEENPYFLNKDQGKAFGYHKVFIQNILEHLWKKPELMFYIILKCDLDDIKYNLSSLIINYFYDNILSSSYMEDNLLYLLSLLLKNEVDNLTDVSDINKFLNDTKCGYLCDQLFKQNDVQVFFKSILTKTVEKIEVLNSNRKISFAVENKEKELIKYRDYFKKENSNKEKKITNLNSRIIPLNLENLNCENGRFFIQKFF